MKVKNELTLSRVQWLIILIFAEAFLIPLQSRLSTGSFPTTVETICYIITGLVQSVTMGLTLLKREDATPSETEKSPNVAIVSIGVRVRNIAKRYRRSLYSVR